MATTLPETSSLMGLRGAPGGALLGMKGCAWVGLGDSQPAPICRVTYGLSSPCCLSKCPDKAGVGSGTAS